MAYEAHYPATPPGTIEVKTLPAGRVLEAEGDHPGVSGQNGAFRTLFRYIKKNDLSMTVPVESAQEPPRMRFFVERERTGDLPAGDGVTVLELPPRTVASLGVRGSYSEGNFREAVGRLEAWLAAHPEWRAAGDPYAVYWNGPLVPGFLKRSEVHLPLAAQSPS